MCYTKNMPSFDFRKKKKLKKKLVWCVIISLVKKYRPSIYIPFSFFVKFFLIFRRKKEPLGRGPLHEKSESFPAPHPLKRRRCGIKTYNNVAELRSCLESHETHILVMDYCLPPAPPSVDLVARPAGPCSWAAAVSSTDLQVGALSMWPGVVAAIIPEIPGGPRACFIVLLLVTCGFLGPFCGVLPPDLGGCGLFAESLYSKMGICQFFLEKTIFSCCEGDPVRPSEGGR